jgi:hypothetical protein
MLESQLYIFHESNALYSLLIFQIGIHFLKLLQFNVNLMPS